VAHLSDDRGQILLVAAFALAVIFVAMALIVNSAIYTENLASRGETAGADGALSMRAQVEANVGDAVTAANRNDNDTIGNLTTAVNASIRTISEQTGQQSARSGRVVEVSNHTYREGRRIYYSGGSSFSDPGTNYQVATGISRVPGANGTRAFVIEASNIQANDNSSAFQITAQKSGATGNANSWRARIWDAGSDTVHVKTLKHDSGSTVVEDCEVTKDSPGTAVTIDVTGGTIDGEECDALATNATTGENFHFAAGTGVTPGTGDSYNISLDNASEIEGAFSMVVWDPESRPSSLDSDRALYDVTVNYTYLTADLRYNTTVRIAPGEPDV